MPPITFNVGPSRLSAEVLSDIKLASDERIMELSHRSEEFSKISEMAVKNLRQYFRIPDDYQVFYAPSAVSSMQSAVSNCCRQRSYHFVCGSFSDMFAQAAASLGKDVNINEAPIGEMNDFQNAAIPAGTDFIAITHNETSTGAVCSMEDIKAIKEQNPEAILVVDITSSAGAVPLNIADADIWFFSVQKCLGLPSGLAIMIISPRAYEKSLAMEKNRENLAGYYTFSRLQSKMAEKYFTINTPNILAIYLLGRQLDRWLKNGGSEYIFEDTKQKYRLWDEFISQSASFDFFVSQQERRSLTSLCVLADENLITRLHEGLPAMGYQVGKGYGPSKSRTFRIANFPAIKEEDVRGVIKVIRKLV
jgi:phosphoserine aminotransferase